MEYMNACALPYVVLAFSEEAALRQYLETHAMTLLVLAQPLTGGGVDIPVLHLVEIPDDEPDTVYRYQCGTMLMEQITGYFRQFIPDIRDKNVMVYMVYSPVGRSGKTALALELTRQLPGSLYIGMEHYSSMEVDGDRFDKLLYSIMQKEERVFEELTAVRQVYYGSYMVGSALSYYDLRELDYEHLSWFLAGLRELGEYSAVVLDVDAGVFATMELLGCADRLFVPVISGDVEGVKLKSMQHAMQSWGYREIYERMEFVSLPNAQDSQAEFQKYVRELLA